MLIGIDASRVSKKEKTGVEWYAHHLIRALRTQKSEHVFRLYTKNPLLFDLPQHWEEKNITWPFSFLWTQGGLSLEMALHAPDLLFVPASALPIIVPRLSVTTIHDIGFLSWRAYRNTSELRYLDWSTRFAVLHATAIIAVSEFTKQELMKQYHAAPERIRVIHEAFDLPPDISLEESEQIMRAHSIVRPYVLYIGRIDSRKNISTLIAAYTLLRERGVFDGDLILVGPVGHDGARILASARHSSYYESIRHFGWISEKEKYTLLRSAVLFAFPSHYEGFGIPVLEAQSVGTPVVCSHTTSLPEVAGGGALFADPTSSDEFALRCQSVIEHGEVREELIARGHENITRFSWEKTAKETLSVFDEIAQL